MYLMFLIYYLHVQAAFSLENEADLERNLCYVEFDMLLEDIHDLNSCKKLMVEHREAVPRVSFVIKIFNGEEWEHFFSTHCQWSPLYPDEPICFEEQSFGFKPRAASPTSAVGRANFATPPSTRRCEGGKNMKWAMHNGSLTCVKRKRS